MLLPYSRSGLSIPGGTLYRQIKLYCMICTLWWIFYFIIIISFPEISTMWCLSWEGWKKTLKMTALHCIKPTLHHSEFTNWQVACLVKCYIMYMEANHASLHLSISQVFHTGIVNARWHINNQRESIRLYWAHWRQEKKQSHNMLMAYVGLIVMSICSCSYRPITDDKHGLRPTSDTQIVLSVRYYSLPGLHT